MWRHRGGRGVAVCLVLVWWLFGLRGSRQWLVVAFVYLCSTDWYAWWLVPVSCFSAVASCLLVLSLYSADWYACGLSLSLCICFIHIHI